MSDGKVGKLPDHAVYWFTSILVGFFSSHCVMKIFKQSEKLKEEFHS